MWMCGREGERRVERSFRVGGDDFLRFLLAVDWL